MYWLAGGGAAASDPLGEFQRALRRAQKAGGKRAEKAGGTKWNASLKTRDSIQLMGCGRCSVCADPAAVDQVHKQCVHLRH